MAARNPKPYNLKPARLTPYSKPFSTVLKTLDTLNSNYFRNSTPCLYTRNV